MAFEDWISNLDDDNEVDKQEYKQILQAYFNDSASAEETVKAYTSDGSSKENIYKLSMIIIQAAREIPASQSKLVELIKAASHLEINLEEFGWAMRDEWNFSDLPPSDPEHSKNRSEWRSINAFAARLTVAKISNEPDSSTSFLLFGLWTLRSALEDREEIDANVPAAAEWILLAGSQIYASTEKYEPQPNGGDPARGGKLWSGARGFSKERWAFWKDAFGALEASEGLDSGTRDSAKEAGKAMDGVTS